MRASSLQDNVNISCYIWEGYGLGPGPSTAHGPGSRRTTCSTAPFLRAEEESIVTEASLDPAPMALPRSTRFGVMDCITLSNFCCILESVMWGPVIAVA